MFEFKPDYELSKKRIDAFWERELIDRPVVQFALAKPPEERVSLPPSSHSTSAERWLDVGYQAEFGREENNSAIVNPGCLGGEGGIRTLGTLARTTVFETAPFNHSGTSPRGVM